MRGSLFVFLFVLVISPAVAVVPRNIDGRKMYRMPGGNHLDRFELMEDTIGLMYKATNEASRMEEYSRTHEWRTEEYFEARKDFEQMETEQVEEAMDQVPSMVWSVLAKSNMLTRSVLNYVEMDHEERLQAALEKENEERLHAAEKLFGMTSLDASLDMENEEERLHDAEFSFGMTSLDADLSKPVVDKREFNLHYDVDQIKDFEAFCDGSIYQFYLCPIRIVPTITGDTQLGVGCNEWTDFEADAFLQFTRETIGLVEKVMSIFCAALPINLGIIPYAGLIVKIPVCFAKFALIAIAYLAEGAIERGDHVDNTYHRYAQNFLWTEIQEIREEIICKEASFPTHRQRGCNGKDDNCDGSPDDCAEDQFTPEIFINNPMGLLRNAPRHRYRDNFFLSQQAAIDSIDQPGLCKDDCSLKSKSVDFKAGECRESAFEISCKDRCDNEGKQVVKRWVDLETPSITTSLSLSGGNETDTIVASVQDLPSNYQPYFDVGYKKQHDDDCSLDKLFIDISISVDIDEDDLEGLAFVHLIDPATLGLRIYVAVGKSVWYKITTTVFDLAGRSSFHTVYWGVSSRGMGQSDISETPASETYLPILHEEYEFPTEFLDL